MITIDLGSLEYFDDELQEFVYEQGGIVRFEYSLKALYIWEEKWRKPFLKGELTGEELADFYMTMALDPMEEKFLTTNVMRTLAEYVGDTQTATTFSTTEGASNGRGLSNKPKVYTSEELYALMISASVPLEFENRNLNRLLVILRIIGSHNTPPKKMSKQDIYKQNASLNAQRKAKMNTKG